MTAVAVYDLLAEEGAEESRRAQFVERLVAECISEVENLTEYEREVCSHAEIDPDLELRILRSFWQLFDEWKAKAEQVLARAVSIKSVQVTGIERLDREIGFALARLKATPEETAKGIAQARQGMFIPARELRNELNARLRA